MEASAIPASVGLARTRIALGAPLLRIRSDEQLVSLFRSGSEEAFRAIHDRYRQRMFAYARQMLAESSVDAEDAVQEIFVRAYSGLRASDRHLALRAWLYRVAHNRCIDELRRPAALAPEELPATAANSGASDPVARLEQRDALRRLIADVRRLPDQQRSALLMRELAGMSYADVSGALGVSVPAVKSLLVRARVGLAQANEARDTSCARIREDLIVSHDRGVRASGLARRHLRDCRDCRQFRSEVRGVSRQLAAFVPALGPIGMIAKLLGVGGAGGGGAAAGSSAVAGSGAVAGGGAATGIAGTGAAASAVAGASHVVTILAAAVVTAGGAIELQHIAPPISHHAHHHRVAAHGASSRAASAPSAAGSVSGAAAGSPSGPAASPAAQAPAAGAASSTNAGTAAGTTASTAGAQPTKAASRGKTPLTLPETVNPDNLSYLNGVPGSATGASTTGPAGAASGTTSSASTGAASTSSASSASSAATGTQSTSGTGSDSTSTTGTVPTTGSSSTGTSGATGSTGAGASTGGGSTAVTVTPATTPGAASPSTSSTSRKATRHSGAVAVFTVTGN